MIGFFPDFYPDELLYSACARFADRVKFPNKHMVIRDLFGKRGLSAIVHFPTRLEYFLSTIPHHNYSANDLINNHTLLPFYEPFLIAKRAANIRKEMKSLSNNHLQTRLAMNVSQVKLPSFLRFCPRCVIDDRKECGETYWHRLHQLAGVLVCPVHKCFLRDSPIRWERESSYLFYAAEDFTNTEAHLPVVDVDDNNYAHQIYLEIARSAQWLLTQQGLSLGQGKLRERYYNTLLKKGFAFYNGKIRISELFEAFSVFYEPKIFEELGCELKNSRQGWLARLVDKTYSGVFYHPIRHLLFLKFLEIDIKDFFTAFVEFKPFNDPPYPCLNKIAPHYEDLTIESCRVTDNITKRNKTRRPVAIFNCNCGFSYQRAGPDLSSKDKLRYDIVREYGNVWEQKLSEHWSNLTLSLSEIARSFGTTPLLIARHAIRLNLPMNTEGSRSLDGYNGHRNPQDYFSKSLETYQAKWLEVLEKYPKAKRKELLTKASTLYLWLQKHDNEWFESHLPRAEKHSSRKERLDWKKLDKELSKKVKKVCREILELSVKPTRVSITEIIRRIGYKSWIEKRDKKLFLTATIIDSSLETLEDFVLRKLKIAEEKFIRINKIPTRNVLIRSAVINNTTTTNSLGIQKAIDNSLQKIENDVISK